MREPSGHFSVSVSSGTDAGWKMVLHGLRCMERVCLRLFLCIGDQCIRIRRCTFVYGGAAATVYLLYSGISGTCYVVCTAAAQRSVAWYGGPAGAFFHSLCGNVT